MRSISTAVIDRTIDRWEGDCSPSTLKNTVSAPTRVLDEAVRDEIIAANPARVRARRRARSSAADLGRKIPTLGEVQSLADACRSIHAAYGDFVLLSALLAARVSEVAGLVVGDIDWDNLLVTIARQYFPGSKGLCLKPTKNRQARKVPILKPLEPVLRRMTDGREHDHPLLRGPRGGVLTTGTLSRATDWTNLVQRLGHPGLRRHDLRHAGATWFANAGVPLHIVSDILGHASIETTKGYLHTSTSELMLAAERTNQHLRQAESAR
ncbi:tyrosine-type recombinase/integrase [Microbacterium elymi]|uniref:Site-specific integrase n=1 Tax=Microbacterium elymi TaxID=2909587 RepID=A0ABY5NJ17_9MICO|nr:site-specific integrase [Microbacterium elymi]UUT35138.1 site-specific integrase [Microbacterium elymi]